VGCRRHRFEIASNRSEFKTNQNENNDECPTTNVALLFTKQDVSGQIIENGNRAQILPNQQLLTNYLFCDEKINVINAG